VDDNLSLSWEQEGDQVRLSLSVAGDDPQAAEEAARSLLLDALPGWLAVRSIETRPLKAEPDFT
jgi:hypothetical protein